MRLGLPYKAKIVHYHTTVEWKHYIRQKVQFASSRLCQLVPSANQLHETIYNTSTTTFSKYRPVHVKIK